MTKQEKNEIPEKKSGKKGVSIYLSNMRRNVDRLKKERGYKLKDIVERSGLKEETVNTFLYDTDLQDCRLATAVGIAKAFGVTVAELAETETMADRLVENIKIYRTLPERSKALIDWHIRNQKFMHEEHCKDRPISIMKPICSNNGNLKRTYDYELFNTSSLDTEFYHKIFFGIRIPCEHYVPFYMPNDILLIANDRDAMKNEHTVVIINDNILITNRMVKDGKVFYYGIRDNALHATDLDTVQIVGYIAKVISE